MAITPTCEICKKELERFGAIVLSPPGKDGSIKKIHVCAFCYTHIERLFDEESK